MEHEAAAVSIIGKYKYFDKVPTRKQYVTPTSSPTRS